MSLSGQRSKAWNKREKQLLPLRHTHKFTEEKLCGFERCLISSLSPLLRGIKQKTTTLPPPKTQSIFLPSHALLWSLRPPLSKLAWIAIKVG